MEFDAEGFQLNPLTGKRYAFKEFAYKDSLDHTHFFETYRKRTDGCRVGVFRTMAHLLRKRKDKAGPDRSFSSVRSQLFRDAKKRAETKGLAFDLTTDWVSGALQQAIESQQVVLGTQGNRQSHPRAPSIDRIIPRLGYTQSNCRIIPVQLNMAKGVWDDDSFLEVIGPEVDRLRELKRKRIEQDM